MAGRWVTRTAIPRARSPGAVAGTHLSTFFSWTLGTVLNLCFLK